jgi:hypothetical protein
MKGPRFRIKFLMGLVGCSAVLFWYVRVDGWFLGPYFFAMVVGPQVLFAYQDSRTRARRATVSDPPPPK